jgi:hypothetical protein
MKDCTSAPCRSPTACGVFGYCRNRNDGKHDEYRYVRHEDRQTFEDNGWRLIDDFAGTHHGEYAVLMGRVTTGPALDTHPQIR